MVENGKVVVGGNEGMHFRVNLKRGTGEFYDSTGMREGTVLLPQRSESTASVKSPPGLQD